MLSSRMKPRSVSQATAASLAASTGHMPRRLGTFNLAPASARALRELVINCEKIRGYGDVVERALDAAVVGCYPYGAVAVSCLRINVDALADKKAGKVVKQDGWKQDTI